MEGIQDRLFVKILFRWTSKMNKILSIKLRIKKEVGTYHKHKFSNIKQIREISTIRWNSRTIN